MKKLSSLFTMVSVVFFSFGASAIGSSGEESYCSSIYPDVNSTTTGCKHIGFMRKQNIMHGYLNGNFGTLDNLTRGQFAKVVVDAFQLNLDNYQTQSFPDVPNTHIFYKHINTLKELGIVSGFRDGLFRPDDTITRAMAMKLIVKSAQLKNASLFPETDIDINAVFPDVPNSHSLAPYIARVYSVNDSKIEDGGRIIGGYVDGRFAPDDPIIRYQIAIVLTRSMKYSEIQKVECDNYFCE
jgi:hypothetical protein